MAAREKRVFKRSDSGISHVTKRVKDIKRKSKEPIVIRVAGGSGTGKTHISTDLAKKLGATLISLDMYYKENCSDLVSNNNWDDPKLIDFALAKKNIADLLSGKSTNTPLYSFITGTREGYQEIKPNKKGIYLLEGIHTLNPKLDGIGSALDIAVTSGLHHQLLRRVVRDTQRTGQKAEDILRQISSTVFPSFKKHIEPHLANADVEIQNNFNPVEHSEENEKQLKARLGGKIEIHNLLSNKNAKLKQISEQKDEYYGHGSLPEGELMRVRTEGASERTLTFKGVPIKGSARRKNIINLVVTNPIEKGLKKLEYKLVRKINKTRAQYSFMGHTVSIDNVHGLGNFVEVQGKRPGNVLKALGFSKKDAITESYYDLKAGKGR